MVTVAAVAATAAGSPPSKLPTRDVDGTKWDNAEEEEWDGGEGEGAFAHDAPVGAPPPSLPKPISASASAQAGARDNATDALVWRADVGAKGSGSPNSLARSTTEIEAGEHLSLIHI